VVSAYGRQIFQNEKTKLQGLRITGKDGENGTGSIASKGRLRIFQLKAGNRHWAAETAESEKWAKILGKDGRCHGPSRGPTAAIT
jgi:hypothetical protein